MITVYLSSSPSPSAGRVDYEIDLSDGDTLPVDVQLYASAVDSEDAGATFTFSWHLLRKPVGSAAALSNANVAEPELLSVDTWGDYFLFCIATNVATSATSSRDPLQAGSSAFVRVFVRSENLALVKPAAGERDWFTHAYEWVDALEAMDSTVQDHETRITALEDATPSLALSDLTDVSVSSLAIGEALVWDGAAWVNDTVSGGGSGTLTVKGETDIGSVDIGTESLVFTGTDGIVITGSDSIPGQYTINAALGSSLDVDITGNAATATSATSATSADTADQLSTPNTLTLSGDLGGSATIGGATTSVSLNATIQAGAVENSMLANSGISFTDGSNASTVSLGGTLTVQGTSNEVEVSQSAGTFTVGLPSTITANLSGNATTATALQTSRTISLTGGATGSASFDGSANAAIAATLATPTTSVRGGTVLEFASATYGNSTAELLNRERVVFNELVDYTHYETSTTSAHVTDIDGIGADQSQITNIGLRSVCLFRNPFGTTMSIEMCSVIFAFGGVNGGDGEYELELVKYANLAAVLSNSYTATGLTLTVSGTDNSPKGAELNVLDLGGFSAVEIAATGYVGLIINNDPKNLGHAMHVQIVGSRPIGTGAYYG